MNALLVENNRNIEAVQDSLRLTNDNVRSYSTVPTAHVRDLVADGIRGNGLAVYFAIADRQISSKGEYFRSNESLAEETGLKTSTVRKWVAQLKKSGYLSIWTKNGGRRMRVCTKVNCYPDSRGVLPSEHPSATQIAPYKENNIKKTTQTENVCVFFNKPLSDKHTSSFGESGILRLVDSFGLERVERGLLAWDATDQTKIKNPIGWLTRAVMDDYEPRTLPRVSQPFTQSAYDHEKIIQTYIGEANENAGKIARLKAEGKPDSQIAYKIWIGKI